MRFRARRVCEAAARGRLQQNRLEGERGQRPSENGVVLSQRQGPFFFPTNAGELKYDGVELGLSVDITPKVFAYVNASFYHSRFGDFVIESEDGDEVLTGNGLPIAPDYVINWRQP